MTAADDKLKTALANAKNATEKSAALNTWITERTTEIKQDVKVVQTTIKAVRGSDGQVIGIQWCKNP